MLPTVVPHVPHVPRARETLKVPSCDFFPWKASEKSCDLSCLTGGKWAWEACEAGSCFMPRFLNGMNGMNETICG